MDADAKREIDALKAQMKAQADQHAALMAQFAVALTTRPKSELEMAQQREAEQLRARIQKVKADAVAIAKAENPDVVPTVLKYRIGPVMHYRSGVSYQPGDIIALPYSDEPRHNPSHMWTAYDSKAARPPTPAEAAEAKALSQLAKEQAVKPMGPLAPKKAARPSDTEI